MLKSIFLFKLLLLISVLKSFSIWKIFLKPFELIPLVSHFILLFSSKNNVEKKTRACQSLFRKALKCFVDPFLKNSRIAAAAIVIDQLPKIWA